MLSLPLNATDSTAKRNRTSKSQNLDEKNSTLEPSTLKWTSSVIETPRSGMFKG